MDNPRRDRSDDDEERTSQRRTRARRDDDDDDDDDDERRSSRRRRDDDDDDDDRQEAQQKRRGSNPSRSAKDDDERDRDDDRHSRRSDTRMAGPQRPIAIAGWIWFACAGLMLMNGTMAFLDGVRSHFFWSRTAPRAIVLFFTWTGWVMLWFGVRSIIGLVRAIQPAGIGSIVLAVYHLVLGLIAIGNGAHFIAILSLTVAVGLGVAAYLALANAGEYGDWRDRREEEFDAQEDERWRRWKRRLRARHDDDYDETDEESEFPEFPRSLAVSYWIWILVGITWIFSGLFLAVLAVRIGVVLNKDPNPLVFPIGAFIVVIGSYFAYAGLRIRNGRATSTLPHGIGSVIVGVLSPALTAMEFRKDTATGTGGSVILGMLLITAGVLALIHCRSYSAWQKDISRS